MCVWLKRERGSERKGGRWRPQQKKDRKMGEHGWREREREREKERERAREREMMGEREKEREREKK